MRYKISICKTFGFPLFRFFYSSCLSLVFAVGSPVNLTSYFVIGFPPFPFSLEDSSRILHRELNLLDLFGSEKPKVVLAVMLRSVFTGAFRIGARSVWNHLWMPIMMISYWNEILAMS